MRIIGIKHKVTEDPVVEVGQALVFSRIPVSCFKLFVHCCLREQCSLPLLSCLQEECSSWWRKTGFHRIILERWFIDYPKKRVSGESGLRL